MFQRTELWDGLKEIASHINSPWAVLEDFNVYLHNFENVGGGKPNSPSIRAFRESLMHCSLFDLGFQGPRFTWERNKLKERLDKCVTNRDDKFLDSGLVPLILSRWGTDLV